MKFQYASDLHLEFPANKEFLKQHPLKPVGDVLILAGDIIPFAALDQNRDFFDWLSDNFKMTYWLPGNHEYYHSDTKNWSGSFCESIRKNVLLVNNYTCIHDNVRLVFSTLWSKIHVNNMWHLQQNISDYRMIRNKGNFFTPYDSNILFELSLAFLSSELTSQADVKTIVVTHHVPTFFNYPQKYKNDPLNEAFATELFDFIESTKANYWIFGHHHSNVESFEIGNTKLITNQLGYVQHNEHLKFNPARFMEL